MAADLTLEQHLEQGNKALHAGEFSGALEHYHAACGTHCMVVLTAGLAPKEYMNFMRRATVYLAMGRTRQAVKDYDTVLELKPDFSQVIHVCGVWCAYGFCPALLSARPHVADARRVRNGQSCCSSRATSPRPRMTSSDWWGGGLCRLTPGRGEPGRRRGDGDCSDGRVAAAGCCR